MGTRAEASHAKGTGWMPRQNPSLERKDKVGFIIPLSKFRFPYFLEFHKQIQRCAAFGYQADVFVGFSSVEELTKYWADFRNLSAWQTPTDWQSTDSSPGGFHEHFNAAKAAVNARISEAQRMLGSLQSAAHGERTAGPSCQHPIKERGTVFCEESGITRSGDKLMGVQSAY